MYEIFERLLKENNVTAYRVAKETGIATATLSDWKKGKSIPKTDKMQKIADYFGVSIEYLTGKSPKEKPTVEDGRLDKMESLINKMENGQENRSVTFMGLGGSKKRFDLSQEQFDALERLVEEMTKK